MNNEWKLHKIKQNLAESPLTWRIGNSSLEMMLVGAEYWVHHHYNGFTNNYHQKQARTGGPEPFPSFVFRKQVIFVIILLARKIWPIRTCDYNFHLYQIIPSLIHFILSVNGVNFYVILNVGKKNPNFLYWFHLYISCWIWKVKHVLVIRSRAKLFCRAANDPSVFTITEGY